MELKNVSRYYPDEMPYGEGFQYFQSEDSQDFYESLGLFTRKYKLCIEPDTGVIRSVDEDASRLYPAGFSVVETDELPDGFDINGDWVFDGDSVVPRVLTSGELIRQAESEKARLMQEATDAIVPLHDAVDPDLDIATDEERSQLLAWKKYRVQLNRVNPEDAPDIEWPVKPE
ncbi:TPA: tail fiber assembly protein [Salmonella enterica]|nr:tail fiber assembly protein [Salmonella enterica subsp. enterica serovar Uganda]HEH9008953.1 tail fiber assembly protein [Salmonella enterica]